MKKQYSRIIIEKDVDGIFIASVPSLPGCRTQAKTYEKAIFRIQEAIKLYLEVLKEKQQLKTVSFEKQPNFLAVEDLSLAL